MLKIGDFSKLSRISIRMLRHYDEIGLLEPKRIDDFTGYRYYLAEQLPVAGRIAALRDMGFGLSAIGEILSSYGDARALEEFLSAQRAQVQAELNESQQRLLYLDTAIQRLRKDETAMNYTVTMKNMPQRYVASLRQVIPAYNQEGMLWQMLMQETAPQQLQPAEECNSLAIFHDDGYKEGQVDVEVQLSVKGSYQNTEHVIFKTEPAIQVASATYQGGYEQLTAVNRSVANWVQDNGYDFDGLFFCIYHVGPHQTQNPDEFVTEVCYRVKKK